MAIPPNAPNRIELDAGFLNRIMVDSLRPVREVMGFQPSGRLRKSRQSLPLRNVHYHTLILPASSADVTRKGETVK
jgi:hypothetical protein